MRSSQLQRHARYYRADNNTNLYTHLGDPLDLLGDLQNKLWSKPYFALPLKASR